MLTDTSNVLRIVGIAALVLAVMTTAARAEGETTTPVAPPPPAAGSCVHPDLDAGPHVAYRWRPRVNAWRARTFSTGTVARRFPAKNAVRVATLGVTTLHSKQAAWYLVLDAKQAGVTCWLKVRLPAAPNNKAGWVERDELIVERVRWQVEVDISDRTVRVYAGATLKLQARAVVGKRATPTPPSGSYAPYAMYDAVRGKATAFTGTWQLATTALSLADPRLGRIGLHGRGGESLRAPLGSAASNGCVRVTNATVDKVVRMIGIDKLFGVPVVIHP